MDDDSEYAPPEEPLKYPLIFDHKRYVPCLRWKKGEYQALLFLHDHTKNDITPLIEIAEIGFDFETEEEVRSVDDHLVPFAKRLIEKWGHRWAFVDLKNIDSAERMNDGLHPVQFVFDDLRAKKAFVIPVTGISRDKAHQDAVTAVVAQDKAGACIRLSLTDLAADSFSSRLDILLQRLKVDRSECHLVVDLESPPSFKPLDGFVKMVRALLAKVPDLEVWRTYTICGTSFPKSMGVLPIGVHQLVRYEWLFYKAFLKSLHHNEVRPSFGDYAIAHPEIVNIDMRLVKPSATLRYTTNDAYYIRKGPNVRDNGKQQYIKFCADLMKSGLFLGTKFSDADEYIQRCARRKVPPGSLTRWRRVGTNHHLEKVVFDISNLNGT
jgi:Beta protein